MCSYARVLCYARSIRGPLAGGWGDHRASQGERQREREADRETAQQRERQRGRRPEGRGERPRGRERGRNTFSDGENGSRFSGYSGCQGSGASARTPSPRTLLRRRTSGFFPDQNKKSRASGNSSGVRLFSRIQSSRPLRPDPPGPLAPGLTARPKIQTPRICYFLVHPLRGPGP